jgi:PAS domain S-box-containing protein
MNPSRGTTPPSPEDTDQLLRDIVGGIRDYAIFLLDPAGHVMTWNAGAEVIKGYKASEIIGSHFSIFYPKEARDRGYPDHELRVAAKEGRYEDEGWRVRKDGSQFWANVIITVIRDAEGTLRAFSKVTRDLTERKRQEDSLRSSEERYRSLVEGVKDYAIFMMDPQGFVLSWNAGARAVKGYEAHEIIGAHFSRFYTPEAIQRHWPQHELEVTTREGRFEDEGWRVRKDGSRFWANVVITAIRGGTGDLIGFTKITRDLTERRLQEKAMRQSEERLRLLVEGVEEYAIYMLDPDGMLVSWNTGAQRITGYTASEVLGKHYSRFYRPEDVATNRPWQELAAAKHAGRSGDEGWRVRKDGSVFWAHSNITALHEKEGGVYGFACVTQDLSQRRHVAALEDAARRMQEFVAMLAHELRNPLAPIRNAVALMGMKGIADPTLEAMRQTIDRQSAQLARILDELLDVNRIAHGKFAIEAAPVDLNEVLGRAVEASKPLIDARGHTFRADLSPEPLRFMGDSLRLTQVIVNLLNNAAKYTAEGGEISFSAAAVGLDIEIRVRDNGRGIMPDMLDRVFDLFVQLNPGDNGSQGGLGVGLALARRVVELHGGTIEARSKGPGTGSEFVVRLPSTPRALHVVEPATPVEALTARGLRVLVVDDNADAADSLALLLEALGQRARTVYDGRAALRVIESFRPDLVLLDLGMPGMDGYEVARQVGQGIVGVRPVLVAVTGWGQEADKQRGRAVGFHAHLVKPCSEQSLRRVLEEVAHMQTDAG